MSRPKLFPADVFDSAAEAVSFFNLERAEGIESIPDEVLEFLEVVPEFDPQVRFGVQPGFKTHYVSVAAPGDFRPWLFAKPTGVTFQVGDERNVAAVYSNWGFPEDIEAPAKVLPTDVWFAPDELFDDGELAPAVEFCLRLSAAWAEDRVRSRP